MPEISIIIYDNGLPSQNQDYLPSRSILQKEFIQSAITKKFEVDPNTMVGIIPLAQNQYNDIITPTKQKDYLYSYISRIKLGDNVDHLTPFNQALFSFQHREISTKNLYVFCGTSVDGKYEDEFFAKILEIIFKGISVHMIFFGECLELYNVFTANVDHPNLHCYSVGADTDFGLIHDRVLFGDELEYDPELAEAIRLSLAEQNKKN